MNGSPPRIAGLQLLQIELPREVDRLLDLAYNLWWTWTPAAADLFDAVDPSAWRRYRNPVEVLHGVDRATWQARIEDAEFMARYGRVVRELDAYLGEKEESWFRRQRPSWEAGPIAYFSMEFGLHQCLQIYSGGLGVLSGDHLKSASDLGLPFVAVGLLYRRGYFQQTVDADGFQQHTYPEWDFTRLPLRPALDGQGREVRVEVPLPSGELAVKAWLAQVGRVPLLLLDTDLRINRPSERPITGVLYVRGREMRLLQEAVLGIGGVRVLEALGIEPGVWHINEGHSALLQLERLRRRMKDSGESFDEALAEIGRRVVFTTHTPVEAGNEQFDAALARPYLEHWARPLAVDGARLAALGHADHGEPGQPLNLTALALRTACRANGVSRIHADTSERMWRHLFPERPPEERVIEAITNGVHLPSWLGPEVRDLLERELGTRRLDLLLDEEIWRRVETIDDAALWQSHQAQKERLMRFTLSRVREQLARHGRPPAALEALDELFDASALTLGFARRFATYKRAGLLFSDLPRLRKLLQAPGRPVRVILAGKAHPADRPGQELVRHLFQLSQEPGLQGHVVFLENYDLRVARMLVQGADVWLNTPRRPLEASGTSGQKAAVNGVLNASVLDGWWPEAFDGENGWAIGGEAAGRSEEDEDREDAHSLYRTLEEEVVPLFYERGDDGLPRAWIGRMKRAMAGVGPRFSSSRMVRDYLERAYDPAAG